MMISSDLSQSETLIVSRYKNSSDGCDKSMTCVQASALGYAICDHVLQALDIGVAKPRCWKGPYQLLLAGAMEPYQAAGQICGNDALY